MKRRWVGFLTAASLAFVMDMMIIEVLDVNTPNGAAAWWMVNFPSFPCTLCCAPFIGPLIASGDDNEPLIRALMLYMTFCSCLTWGGIGYWSGKVSEKPKLLGMLGEAAEDAKLSDSG